LVTPFFFVTMKNTIFPIFLSGYPCLGRCVYCNAALSSGVGVALSPETIQADIDAWLDRSSLAERREIALYGNDLNALPVELVSRILTMCRHYVTTGRVQALRTSIRPDSVLTLEEEILSHFAVIELGVPSMDPSVLKASNRGHNCESVEGAFHRLRDLNIDVGCQTMLGLPRATRESDIRSAEIIRGLRPDFVRIHPSLVLKNTPLAELFETSRYVPLALEEAVELSADVWDVYAQDDIPVIRCGFYIPEAEHLKAFLAGPWHPAFGQLVRSRRWRRRLQAMFLASGGEHIFYVDASDYSDAIGHKHENLLWLKGHCHPEFKIVVS
jgi:histone acetyltransferase (RNA polymerase elongator complex component)